MEYSSSEEFQRHQYEAFATKEAKKTKEKTTDSQRVAKLLDLYIKQHSSTVSVRKLAKETGRTNEYQLDLSADIVVILERIKEELR